MSKFYSKSGEEISMALWAGLHNEVGYSKIGYIEIGDWIVSTVWLGLSYRSDDDSPPIFETIVSNGINYQERYYSTREAADAGHAAAVAEVEARLEV